MKANEFVKEFGWEKAWECLNLCASPNDKWFLYENQLISDHDFDDLERLVESWELVSKHRGISEAKKDIVDAAYLRMEMIFGTKICDLKKAITDVESCQ